MLETVSRMPLAKDRESVRNCAADPPRAVLSGGIIDKNARWHAAWTFTDCASGARWADWERGTRGVE